MSLIELADVRKTYRSGSLRVAALRGITLTIDDGEYVAIMGPSGSGKSTLMHIMGCLDGPSEGRYRLAGEDVSEMTEAQLADVRNRRVGFVFQQFNLLATMPAWRNVELPLTYAGVGRADRRERAGRALVTEPDLLLADEPTGNLDSASTAEILGLLDELHRTGRTIVVITHEADVARRSERTVRLLDGLVAGDTPTSAVTR